MQKLLGTILALLAGLLPLVAAAMDESALSIEPPVACKRPAATLPKIREEMSWLGHEVASISDLNGDGWCDLAYKAWLGHNPRVPNPEARDLIWLGSEKGWGWYVKPEHWHGQWDSKKGDWIIRPRLTVPERMKFIAPGDELGMRPPLLAYPKTGGPPYFIGVYRYPRAIPFYSYDDFVVYRWDKEFNMPREVSDAELVVVLRFWRRHYCTGKQYTYEDFRYSDDLTVQICSPAAQEAIDKAQERLAAEPKSP